MSQSSTTKCEPSNYQPERCGDVLASITEAVITTDAEGRITYLNAAATTSTGWTPDEAVGVLLDEIFIPSELEMRTRAEHRSVDAQPDVVTAELRTIRRKDGAERQVNLHAAPYRDGFGPAAGVVWTFRDVTDFYRHEQLLEDAASYSDSIIAALREPFLVLDRQLRVKTANAAFYATFETIEAATDGRPLYELNAGQWDSPKLRSALSDVLAGNSPVGDLYVDQDGSPIGPKRMRLHAAPFRMVDGRPEMVLLAIEDATACNDADVAQSADEQYRRLFQTAKDGILILDADTMTVIDANPFMTELLEYLPDELLGKQLWEIGFFADKRASQSAYWELREQAYIRYDHLPLETKGGLRVDVEFICNTYQMGGKNVAQCNIRDIGDRSRLEKKTKEQAAALVDLHKRKDEFLAMLSHELRNPLAPIADAVQLLRLHPGDASVQKRGHNIIERQVKHLTRLIDDLMEVSRITTGRIRLHLEPVAVNDVVKRAVESAQHWMDDHRHELTFSPSPEPLWIHGDAARIEQVVVNLLGNAAKYTPNEGLISVVVAQQGHECVLRVRDNGIGIAPELLPKIFDLFAQGERSLDRSQGGLGIGLALVQRLVGMQHGRVEVISSLGQGSEFIVRFPVVSAPAPESSAPPAAAEPALPAHHLRVLVVDDNLDAAECLSLRLGASGHEVKTAADGPNALETAHDFHPDVVLLDIGLPGMDGYEVAKKLRADPVHHNIQLVAITGYGEASARQRSLEAGFDHHLVKPANAQKLDAILADIPETAPSARPETCALA